MTISFRFPPDKMNRLEQLAKRLRKSKAQVVMQAIDNLYEEEMKEEGRSLLDLILGSDFTPLLANLGDLAADEKKQRQIIRQKILRERGRFI